MPTKSNKLENLTFNFLVMPYEDAYMAMCEETGIIRSGATPESAREALISATETLVKAVMENQKLEPSLTVGLPFRYKLLFNWTVTRILFRILTRIAMDRFFYQTRPARDFYPSLA